MLENIKAAQQKMESIDMSQEVPRRIEVVQRISYQLLSSLKPDDKVIFEDSLLLLLM